MNESKLFEWLKERKLPDLKKSGFNLSRWDCSSEEAKKLIELKCRRKHYPDMLIEKKKYDAMVSKAEELGYQAYYINSTPFGIYSWNLTEATDIEWKVETRHPATTHFGNTARVPKEVGYLRVEDAVMLKEF